MLDMLERLKYTCNQETQKGPHMNKLSKKKESRF